MPLYKTAQRNSLFRPALDDFYVFPEVHKGNWMRFFEAMDADEEKILSWAEKSDIKHPKAWYESLHKFLFDVYSGTPKLLKKAAKESFQAFLKDVRANHMKNPKPDYWYHHQQGVTLQRFVDVLQEAAELAEPEQAISYINARMMNLGYHLYSEYILSKTDQYKKVKHVASEMNREAYDLECLALGKNPLSTIEEGDFVYHTVANEKFKVERVIWDDPDHTSLSTIVARNDKNAPVVFTDLWNLKQARA
jgi:hypothetical protein